jgi:hypothetical protein
MDTSDALMLMADKKLAELREKNILLRACLGSIYQNGVTLTGRECVQALLDSGHLKKEELPNNNGERT